MLRFFLEKTVRPKIHCAEHAHATQVSPSLQHTSARNRWAISPSELVTHAAMCAHLCPCCLQCRQHSSWAGSILWPLLLGAWSVLPASLLPLCGAAPRQPMRCSTASGDGTEEWPM